MLSSNLEIIAMWLAEAKAPEEVFGKLANVDELHVVYRRLDSITIETTRKNFRDMIEEWLEHARKSN